MTTSPNSGFHELIEEAKQVAEERDKNIEISGESVISPVGYFKLLSSTKALFSYLNLNTKTYNEMIKEHCTDRVNPGILQGILDSALQCVTRQYMGKYNISKQKRLHSIKLSDGFLSFIAI